MSRGPDLYGVSGHDVARVLRDYGLEALRRSLGRAQGSVVAVSDGIDAGPLATRDGSCDGVWIGIESLEGVDLPALAGEVARALRRGGRLVCVVPGAWPLPRLLVRGLRGRGEPAGARRGVDGGAQRVSFGAWRRAFEPAIRWRSARAFGALVPPAATWPHLHPLLLGLLAMGEHVMGRWPVVRTLGDWVVHEGVRR